MKYDHKGRPVVLVCQHDLVKGECALCEGLVEPYRPTEATGTERVYPDHEDPSGTLKLLEQRRQGIRPQPRLLEPMPTGDGSQSSRIRSQQQWQEDKARAHLTSRPSKARPQVAKVPHSWQAQQEAQQRAKAEAKERKANSTVSLAKANALLAAQLGIEL